MSRIDKILSIVFVSYNCGRDIVQLIEFIKESGFDLKKLEIVVVDNASSDNSISLLQQIDGLDYKLIKSKENLGFGSGCNLAFESLSDSKYVLLLNPDIHIEKNTISRLVDFAQRNPNAKVWGAREESDEMCGLREPTFISFLSWLFFLDFLLKKIGLSALEAYSVAEVEKNNYVDAVAGFCLMIDAELLKKLNGFDERFFMYSEEVDLCRRARELGASPMIDPSITLIHELSKTISSDNKLDFLYKSKLKYFYKHWSYLKFTFARVALFFGSLLRVVIFSAVGVFHKGSRHKSKQWFNFIKKQLAWSF